ncbi:hypothetical protein JTE90_024410 [Oedothorax gibbosus]|uniref:Uncharacterized protein n=1 Tax=Oedothorax gibbosus TaxID=931172 RepID=A0AAV6TEJ3_9ARAC|nr:hypothetical protein JTE90_024410 [Oedothorax gibbosus]
MSMEVEFAKECVTQHRPKQLALQNGDASSFGPIPGRYAQSFALVEVYGRSEYEGPRVACFEVPGVEPVPGAATGASWW